MTLLVNLLGAPCSGKSTTRADVFRILKQRGVNCEEVYETAKKLSWTKRTKELSCQPYILGKQLRDIELLQGQVDVIITDSPLILSEFYNRLYQPGVYPVAFGQFVIEQFKAMGGLNVYLNRVGPYVASGRNQTEAEADAIGVKLLDLLDEIDVRPLVIDGDAKAGPMIADIVVGMLAQKRRLASWPFSA